MALDPVSITGLLTASMNANSLVGAAIPQLAGAVANGFVSYIIAGVTLVTVDTGLAGSGTGIGVGIMLSSPVLQGSLTSALAGASMQGMSVVSLATAIASGLSQALATANLNTIHAGVGSGTGVVTVIPSSGIPFFTSAFAAAGLLGASAAALASAVATGLDASLSSGIGNVTIAGAAVSSPGAGTGTGKIS